MLKKSILLVCVATVWGAMACSHKRKGTLRGYVRLGPEHVSFQACESDRMWWIAGENADGWSAAKRILDAQPACDLPNADRCLPQEVFIEADGHFSDVGHYGHLGAYEREVRFSRVYWAGRKTPEACEQMTPWSGEVAAQHGIAPDGSAPRR